MTVEKEELTCVTPSVESESRHVTVEDVEWDETINEAKKSVKRKLDVAFKSCDEVLCAYCCICMCAYLCEFI